MDEYFPKDESFAEKFLAHYREDLEHQGIYETIARKLDGVGSLFPLVTARGCTHKCSFCYRHMNRYRRHSIGYVIGHLKYVIEKFGVRGVGFYDELFNGDMQWVLDFCAALRENNIKIAYKTSARADKGYMESLLKKYPKDTNKLDVYLRQYYLEVLDEVLSGVQHKYIIRTGEEDQGKLWLMFGKDPQDMEPKKEENR